LLGLKSGAFDHVQVSSDAKSPADRYMIKDGTLPDFLSTHMCGHAYSRGAIQWQMSGS